MKLYTYPFNFNISIHAPTRGATVEPPITKGCVLFQSTLPREERPLSNELKSSIRYFNPRSHERSDVKFLHGDGFVLISIHAPTRGATRLLAIIHQLLFISIHAPTRGATYHYRFNAIPYTYFNPRSHERSDCCG